jgi:hypothetical protein
MHVREHHLLRPPPLRHLPVCVDPKVAGAQGCGGELRGTRIKAVLRVAVHLPHLRTSPYCHMAAPPPPPPPMSFLPYLSCHIPPTSTLRTSITRLTMYGREPYTLILTNLYFYRFPCTLHTHTTPPQLQRMHLPLSYTYREYAPSCFTALQCTTMHYALQCTTPVPVCVDWRVHPDGLLRLRLCTAGHRT